MIKSLQAIFRTRMEGSMFWHKKKKHLKISNGEKLYDESAKWAKEAKKKSQDFIKYRENDKTTLVHEKGKKNLTVKELKQYEEAKEAKATKIINSDFLPSYSYELKDARTIMRKSILTSMKNKDLCETQRLLNELYYLAVLYGGCWGAIEGIGGLYADSSKGFQDPEEWLRKNANKARIITYQKYGRLIGDSFLSGPDWKRIQKYLSTNHDGISPRDVRSLIQ
jgi:hypothetical protein